MRLTCSALTFVGVTLVLAACLAEDPLALPAPAPDAGPSDAGATPATPATPSEGGPAALPLIDQYSVSSADLTASVAACTSTSNRALDEMGGGYVTRDSPASGVLYGDRNGATLSVFCVPTQDDRKQVVVTTAQGLTGALNAQNDEARLKDLVQTGATTSPLTVSPPAGATLPTPRYAQKLVPFSGTENQASCAARAEKAIAKALEALPASPKKWTRSGAPLLAAGGTDGTTGTYACVGAPVFLAVILQIATIDPGADLNALINTFETAYTTQ